MADSAAVLDRARPTPEHDRAAGRHVIGFGLGLVVVLAGVSMFVGVSAVSPVDVWADAGTARAILFQSRLPRTIAVVLAGASLSVAGLIMQATTQNRFVSPSTAGTTEAATLGLVIGAVVMPGADVAVKMMFATGFALVGTMLFVSLIQQLRSRDIIVVPLIGIMLGAVLESIAVFIAFRQGLLQSLYSWILGDFSGTIAGRYELLYVVAIAGFVGYRFADRFTLASVGREFSINVGLSYDRVVLTGMTIVSVISGIVIVVVGAVPFLGLIVPNLVTAAFGDHLRRILPLTAIAGAAVLLVGDIAARTVRFPHEIPVGVIVGVVGGGAFLVLLLRQRS